MATKKPVKLNPKQPPPPNVKVESTKDFPKDEGLKTDEVEVALQNPAFKLILDQLNQLQTRVDSVQIKVAPKSELDLIPVPVSEIMSGFQASLAKANNAIMVEEDTVVTETMIINNLEVSFSAIIVEDEHAQDPVIMLPSSQNVDQESPKVFLKFNVVSTPVKS